ncbi:hypothetical protein DAI22_01g158200 [Oryza sativa Japonica Group]|nr:hypothetical protein DAI22_01g158200 [Oryza sativa Japonica Group]
MQEFELRMKMEIAKERIVAPYQLTKAGQIWRSMIVGGFLILCLEASPNTSYL